MDHLNHGGLDFSVTIAENRTFMIFHLNYAYFLGITFNGIYSFDETVESIRFQTLDILEAINPTHPE
jgi:hypothetical protein